MEVYPEQVQAQVTLIQMSVIKQMKQLGNRRSARKALLLLLNHQQKAKSWTNIFCLRIPGKGSQYTIKCELVPGSTLTKGLLSTLVFIVPEYHTENQERK